MIALLAKFRIEADDVIIISDATKKPSEYKVAEFNRIIESYNNNVDEGSNHEDSRVSDMDLQAQREKTNFYLRISEVINMIN